GVPGVAVGTNLVVERARLRDFVRDRLLALDPLAEPRARGEGDRPGIERRGIGVLASLERLFAHLRNARRIGRGGKGLERLADLVDARLSAILRNGSRGVLGQRGLVELALGKRKARRDRKTCDRC